MKMLSIAKLLKNCNEEELSKKIKAAFHFKRVSETLTTNNFISFQADATKFMDDIPNMMKKYHGGKLHDADLENSIRRFEECKDKFAQFADEINWDIANPENSWFDCKSAQLNNCGDGFVFGIKDGNKPKSGTRIFRLQANGNIDCNIADAMFSGESAVAEVVGDGRGFWTMNHKFRD